MPACNRSAVVRPRSCWRKSPSGCAETRAHFVSESWLFNAVEYQQLGSSGQFQDRVLAVEAEPFDRPIERAQNKDPQRNDLDISPNFSRATRVEKELVPVFRVSPAQWA